MWAYLGWIINTTLNTPTPRKHQLLIHKHQVTPALLSMLNTNPFRRPSLDTVLRRLACPLLWSPVVPDEDEDDGNSGGMTCAGNLLQHVRDTIDMMVMEDPALATPNEVRVLGLDKRRSRCTWVRCTGVVRISFPKPPRHEDRKNRGPVHSGGRRPPRVYAFRLKTFFVNDSSGQFNSSERRGMLWFLRALASAMRTTTTNSTRHGGDLGLLFIR